MILTITQTADNKIHVETKGTFTLESLTNTLLTVIIQANNSSIATAPPAIQQSIRDHVYDSLNYAFSNALANFDPTQDLRPHLTEEAILHAENEILQKLPKM